MKLYGVRRHLVLVNGQKTHEVVKLFEDQVMALNAKAQLDRAIRSTLDQAVVKMPNGVVVSCEEFLAGLGICGVAIQGFETEVAGPIQEPPPMIVGAKH